MHLLQDHKKDLPWEGFAPFTASSEGGEDAGAELTGASRLSLPQLLQIFL